MLWRSLKRPMWDWLECISKLTGAVDARWDALKRDVKQQLNIEDPAHIMPYNGYGTPERLLLKGRVLQDEGISLREEDAPVWKNLVNMYRRFETDEIPGAKVQIQIDDQQQEVITDDEGFFEADIDLHQPLTGDDLWQPAQLRLRLEDLDSRSNQSDSAQGEAIVVSDRAEFGVISDIDDTIMHTAATDVLKMIAIAYLGNERTRRPFEGVPEFYQALQRGQPGNAGNPIFYVSSSAWNMYDLFDKFMRLNDVPKGPILLRDIELDLVNLLSFDHESHKLEQVCPVLERFPGLPFILIGDTGQRDSEIYHRIVEDYPGRILAVYLRNVTPNDQGRMQELAALGEAFKQQGVEYLVFAETAEAVRHAADQGWIVEAAI